MRAKLVAFGEVQIKSQRYAHHVVIEARRIRRRRKGPSKALRAQFGHTPSFLRTPRSRRATGETDPPDPDVRWRHSTACLTVTSGPPA